MSMQSRIKKRSCCEHCWCKGFSGTNIYWRVWSPRPEFNLKMCAPYFAVQFQWTEVSHHGCRAPCPNVGILIPMVFSPCRIGSIAAVLVSNCSTKFCVASPCNTRESGVSMMHTVVTSGCPSVCFMQYIYIYAYIYIYTWWSTTNYIVNSSYIYIYSNIYNSDVDCWHQIVPFVAGERYPWAQGQ